jgi:hypothetical protein
MPAFRPTDPDSPRRSPDRSWATRLAWATLVGGGALLIVRAFLATVVQVHGDGMAPTIVDGDTVMLLRGRWAVGAGDIVVYDPAHGVAPGPVGTPPLPDPGQAREDPGEPDARARPVRPLRDTAVVDEDELEGRWDEVTRRAAGSGPRALRLGRVLACPGDTVTFNLADASMGIAVNGARVQHKPGETIRIVLRAEGPDGPAPGSPRLRTTAYESMGELRWPVLTDAAPRARWNALELPPDPGPVEVRAPGYLVLADNRPEGACCDSRALGWIDPEAIRGEVVARLAGNSRSTPDLDPRTRGASLLP